jgi:phosphate starvation-inducible PhoH-like protein
MSGLVEALKIVRDVEGIGFVYFDEKDVVRHKLVQQIVKAYEAFTAPHRAGVRGGEPAAPAAHAGMNGRGPATDD